MSNHPFQRGIDPLIADFTKQSGITVNVQTFAEQQARDKILLNMQSKANSMDVFMTLPSREGVQFQKAGYYQSLDDYVAKAAAWNVSDFSAGTMAAMKQGGKIIAVPINVEGPVLYYRTDVLESLGLKPPTTITELLDTCKTIKEKGNGMIPITLRGAAAALPFTFGPVFHGEGIEWTTNGVPNFDKPQAIEAIRIYATLAKDYGPPGVINYSFTESSNLFAQGKVAMELESSNELNSIIDPKSSTVVGKIGVIKMPRGSARSQTTVLSWGLGMSPFAANKDAGWTFIEWATSAKTQLALTKANIAPPRASVAKDPSYTATLNDQTKKDWAAAVEDVQTNGNAEVGPVGSQAAAMRTVIGNGVGKAIAGQATPAQAAAEIQAGLIPMLKE